MNTSQPSSLERDLFPGLAAEGRLAGAAYGGFFVDIGVPEALAGAQASVAAWREKPALLLDRDDTLNVDRGWATGRRTSAGSTAPVRRSGGPTTVGCSSPPASPPHSFHGVELLKVLSNITQCIE